MSRFKIYRFPAEPSIVGFILFATILGAVSSKEINYIYFFLLVAIQLNLIFTIDNVYRAKRFFELPTIYALISNGIPYIALSILDYDVLYSFIPLSLLLILTIYSAIEYGREHIFTNLIGTISLGYMVITSSAIVGKITQLTVSTWVVYTFYLVISVLYIEARLGKINDLPPVILANISFIIYYLLNPIYAILSVDLNAKTLTHYISRNYIDKEKITKLGISEMKRLLVFSIILIILTITS